MIGTTNRYSKVKKPVIGSTLGLLIYYIDKKVPLDIFRDKLSKYLVGTVKSPEYVI